MILEIDCKEAKIDLKHGSIEPAFKVSICSVDFMQYPEQLDHMLDFLIETFGERAVVAELRRKVDI